MYPAYEINIFIIRIAFIIAGFVIKIKSNQNKGCQRNSQSANIHRRNTPIFPEIAQGDF
ncbi:hypothetical protein D9M68_489430 [compost metagenome]